MSVLWLLWTAWVPLGLADPPADLPAPAPAVAAAPVPTPEALDTSPRPPPPELQEILNDVSHGLWHDMMDPDPESEAPPAGPWIVAPVVPSAAPVVPEGAPAPPQAAPTPLYGAQPIQVALAPTPVAVPSLDLTRWLPSLHGHGLQSAARRLGGSLFLFAVAWSLRRARRPLKKGAPFTRVLNASETFFRVLGVLVGLGAAAVLLPHGLLPLVTWTLVAAALGLGWSTRSLLADLVAGLTLQLNREVQLGGWLEGAGFAGAIQDIGLRALVLEDASGARHTVPYSALIGGHFVTRRVGGPPVATHLDLDPTLPPERVRAAALRVVRTSPWVDAAAAAEVIRDPNVPGRWTLRVHLLDGGFRDEHLGTLRERLDAELAARRVPAPPPAPVEPS